MRFPSGDQAGFAAGCSVFVRRQASPPAAPMTQTWPFSSPRSLTKAMWRPSGDQRGEVSRLGPFVSCTTVPPATSATLMWEMYSFFLSSSVVTT